MTATQEPTASTRPIDDTTSAAAALDARLADPAVANSLIAILDHADLLAMLVEGLDGFVARSEVIGDSLLESINDLRTTAESTEQADGINPGEVAKAGLALAAVLPKAAPGMVQAVESGAIDRLLASDLVSPQAVSQIEILARALTQGSAQFERQPLQVGGPLSLVKLLRDDDIQRAVSYFATVAKAIGQQLANSTSDSKS